MKPDYEFRCYVHDRKLTAISQYHCYCKFDALQDIDRVEKIRTAIMNYHELVKDAFPVPSYVIDIHVNPDDYSCGVIELNPFGSAMSSGSGLFHWERDEDLLYGRSDLPVPAIRILKNIADSKSAGKPC